MSIFGLLYTPILLAEALLEHLAGVDRLTRAKARYARTTR